ncbi:MAG: hypothetical protein AAB521_04270 [Patescibacteria group bacterium]
MKDNEGLLGRFITNRERNQPITTLQSVGNYMLSSSAETRGRPKDYKYAGMAAIFRTSEAAYPMFIEELRDSEPNGYLIGVGTGGIFTLLQAFDKPPEGIVIADINPYVVIGGRVMVEMLLASEGPEEFTNNFFKMPQEDYWKIADAITQKDKTFRRGLKDWHISLKRDFYTPMISANAQTRHNIPEVVTDNFAVLKKLAQEGEIAVCYTDILNPDFVQAIEGLPDFKTTASLIYISNIVSLMFEGDPRVHDIRNLATLETNEAPPVFISADSKNDLDMHKVSKIGDISAPRWMQELDWSFGIAEQPESQNV